MHTDNLSREELLILLSCCANPSAEKIAALEKLLEQQLDWWCIINIARLHGIAPFICNAVNHCSNKGSVPALIVRELNNDYHRSAFINLVFLKEYESILQQCNINKIKIIPLKGIVLIKEIYKNIALRTLSDIDLLIHKHDLERGINVLRDLGYTQKKTVYQHEEHFHLIFQRCSRSVPITVELHWDVDIPDSPYHIAIDDLWERAIISQHHSGECYRLSLEDSILFNCFHIMRKPLAEGIIIIKNFCDIYEILIQRQPDIKWHMIMNCAEQYRIVRPVFLVLLFLERYFAAPVPPIIGERLKREGFQEEMFVDIIHKRIFTRNSEKIFVPGMLVFSQERRWYQFPLNVGSVFTTFSRLCKYFMVHTRFPSLQGMIIVFKRVKRSVLNYARVIYLYIFKYHRMKTLHRVLLHDKKRIDLIDQWLRGI